MCYLTLCVTDSQGDGLHVDGHSIIDIIAVAAHRSNGNRYMLLICEVEDFPIAPNRALQRQPGPVEPITLVQTYAGQVDDQLQFKVPDQDVGCADQCLQIASIAVTIVQTDVQI